LAKNPEDHQLAHSKLNLPN